MKDQTWSQHQFWFTDHISVPLPPGHRFPMTKYRLLREALLEQGLLSSEQLHPAPLASMEDLLRAHTAHYVEGLKNNTLDIKETRPIGLPVGEDLFRRSLAGVGGFVQAAESSLETGFAAQLAGGTHHAFADHGEGFCVFNDFAVAALKLLSLKKVKRILILDLDVHQGNGTSAILGNRNDVFIVSLHGERNYPFRKVPSHLDVPLPAGIQDPEYLMALNMTLDQISKESYDMIFYQAGVDVLEHDKLGTFKLTFEGIRKRDRLVFELARQKSVPLALAIGGGYSSPIEHTVSAHVGTFLEARKIFS